MEDVSDSLKFEQFFRFLCSRKNSSILTAACFIRIDVGVYKNSCFHLAIPSLALHMSIEKENTIQEGQI